MTTEISSISGLPDWFDLSAYGVCDTFTSKEWGTQLLVRKHERAMVRIIQHAHDSPGLASASAEDLKTRLMARIGSGCVREPKDQRRIAFERESNLYAPNAGGMDFYGCVRPALLDDLANNEHSPENYFLAYDEVFPSHHITLDVDLSASDSALQEKFIDVIRKYRKIRSQKNPGKSGTEASLDRLRLYKVLLYLDLYHWAELSDAKIHAEIMARALFPDSNWGGRFVLSTLNDWAERAIQPGFIGTLLAPG